MNNNIEDILSDDKSDNQKRLIELNDVLKSEEIIPEDTDDDFEKDAAEGLQQIERNNIPILVNELNQNLKSQLKNKKRTKKQIPDQSAVLITVVTLLLLVVVAFVIIKKYYQ